VTARPGHGRAGRADPGYLLDAAGVAAPPRDNGELVFAEPWESQAFGVAMALHQAGHFAWEDFRQRLIAEIGDWQAHRAGQEEWNYYRCWLRALERTLAGAGLVSEAEVGERAALLAAQPDRGHARHEHGGREHGGREHGGREPSAAAPSGAGDGR